MMVLYWPPTVSIIAKVAIWCFYCFSTPFLLAYHPSGTPEQETTTLNQIRHVRWSMLQICTTAIPRTRRLNIDNMLNQVDLGLANHFPNREREVLAKKTELVVTLNICAKLVYTYYGVSLSSTSMLLVYKSGNSPAMSRTTMSITRCFETEYLGSSTILLQPSLNFALVMVRCCKLPSRHIARHHLQPKVFWSVLAFYY